MFLKRSSKLVVLLFLLFFAYLVFGYDNIVIHPKITGQAILLYNKNADRKIAPEQVDWIIDGAVAEDTDPRYLNHYYNPVNGQGLSGWDELHGVPIKVSGIPAKQWAKNQDSASGDYSISTIFNNYREGNLKRAYQGVGHILHLIQDMAVPAHTRNDSHAMGDPYEKWAKQYGAISLDKTKYIEIDSMDGAFDNLANYSNNNFVSKDSTTNINIDDYQKLEKEVNGVKIKYLIKNYEGKNYKFCIFDDSSIRPIYKYNDDLYLNIDYWNMLYPKTVGYSAGAINYFVKEFEKIDEEKSKISFWDKISIALSKILDTKENDRYLWGDAFLASRNAITDGWHNLTGATGQVYDFSKLVIESGGEVINNTANKSIEAAKDAGGKVLSAIENPITAEDLLIPQKAKGEKNNSISASQPEQEKVEVLSSEYKFINKKTESPIGNSVSTTGVSYVIDGDTIVLTTGEKVRYIGIDTPELNSEGARDDECLAWAARLRNMELLGKGELKLVKDSAVDKDQYGRLLRYVYSGDVFINEQLGREGLAEEFFCKSGWQNCPITADQSRQEIIQKAVDSAEQNKRGLFSGVCEPEKKEDESENKNKETGAEQIQGGNSAAKSNSSGQASPFVFGIGSPAPQSPVGGGAQSNEQLENGQSEDENSQSSFIADEEEESKEETEEITPIITQFNLYDLTSSSTTWTASVTVGVDLKIENQEPVNGYFLSISSTTPAMDNGDWAASSPEYFILPEENGKKTIYLWLKYSEDNITDATSSSIILDIAVPAEIIKTAVDYIVISEVRIDGEEFMELYNPIDNDVDMTGWHLCYYSSGRDWNDPYRSKPFSDNAIIKSKGYYLIAIVNSELSGADWNLDYTSHFLSNTAGSIAIFPFDPAEKTAQEAENGKIDAVGWGNVSYVKEGNPSVASGDSQSLERKAFAASTAETMASGGEHQSSGNGYDSNDNSQDFIIKDIPEPQNSYSSVEPLENIEIIPDVIDDLEVRHICASGTLTRPKMDLNGRLTTQTLTADKSPYYFTGTVYLIGNSILTIEPGVVIKFGGEYFNQWYMYPVIFLISGKIIAQGTETNPIVFTSIYDDSYCGDSNGDGAATAPEPGSWGSFQISSGNNIFDHAIVKYGGDDKRGLFAFYNKEGVNQITNSVFVDNLNDSRICSASSTKSLIVGNNFCYYNK